MVRKLPKAIKVASVTVTTVSVTCDRCKAVASGPCSYPNHEMFVSRELKYITIHTNRGTRSMYPQIKVVCPKCAQELEDFFMGTPVVDEVADTLRKAAVILRGNKWRNEAEISEIEQFAEELGTTEDLV